MNDHEELKANAGGAASGAGHRPSGFRTIHLAYVLIGLGAFMLAARLGWLDWRSVFRVAELWPVILVAIGIDMLTGGRRRLLVYGAALVTVAALLLGGGGLMRTAANSVPVAQPLQGAAGASVHLAPGVAVLELAGSAQSSALAEGMLGQRPGEEVRVDYERRGDRAHLNATVRRTGARFPTLGHDVRWSLDLTGRVPIALSVDAGVGTSILDLRQLQIESLDVNSGVGQVTVIMPANGSFIAAIDGGVGSTILRVPRSLAIRIDVNTGIGRVNVASHFGRANNVYTSPSYASASQRVDLNINAGVGEVTIEAID